MQHGYTRALAAGIAAAVVSVSSAQADDKAVADFYKNKTVTVVIGSGMGGSYGLYGQLTSQFLGPHIPGKPRMVIQSMPGGGGMKALGYAYNVAPQDGSVVLGTHQEVLQETVLNPKAKFDVRNFRWLGRYVGVEYVGFVSGKKGVKTLDQARKEQVIFGATGARAANALGPLAFNRFAGTNFKVVAGYKGTSEMFTAVQRGELDAVTATWVVMKAFHMPKIKSGALVPVFTWALERLPEYPDVPAITEFGSNDEEKKFLNFWASGGMIGRSAYMPPNVPADRLAALRKGWDAMVASKEFREGAAKRRASLNIMRGEEIEKRIAKVMQMSDTDIAAARRIYGELLKSARAAPKRVKK